MKPIDGYTYQTVDTVSPILLEDLNLLKKTVLFSEKDKEMLLKAGEVLADQTDAILDLWYGFVGSHDHLIYYFTDGKNLPDPTYLEKVRARFGQWIHDLCTKPYDQTWLNYQHEIGLRHTRAKKNQTDQVTSVDHIGLRYMIAFIVPITVTIKSFLAAKGDDEETVDQMYTAWFKAVTLSVVLWSVPYTKIDDF